MSPHTQHKKTYANEYAYVDAYAYTKLDSEVGT